MMVHDTLSGGRVSVGGAGPVSVYVCGITAYDDAHVGHMRSAIVFDVLRRHLEKMGHGVRFVQNYTDVDDKIIARAAEEGCGAAELAERYIASYEADAEAAGVARPTVSPRATAHIGDMISMIRSLVDKGAAYATDTGVYFDVSGFGRYGRLSRKRTTELRAGARVGVDPTKRDALDFALWKVSDAGPSWPSPWGRGRPGWHIECSAMCEAHLRGGIDIHGGGRDLIFPHHENEIAQSEAHSGRPLARAWMHVGMVRIGGEKMSKSAGNLVTARDVIAAWGANALRIFCLRAHYSKPVDYDDASMSECLALWRQAESAYYELRRAGAGLADDPEAPIIDESHNEKRAGDSRFDGSSKFDEFVDALDDDLDTRRALGAIFSLAESVNADAAGGRLGSGQAKSAMSWLGLMMDVAGLRVATVADADEARLDALADKREALRAGKRYAEADAVRDQMRSMGVDVMDHAGGTVWVRREPAARDAPTR